MAFSRMATRFSCEPMRTSAYSEDIRWRMVWQREVQGLTLEQVAWNLSVDVSTVHRIVKKLEETESVSEKKYSVANRHQLQTVSFFDITVMRDSKVQTASQLACTNTWP